VEGDRERFLEAGMNAYVSKPMTADSLAATLCTLFPETGRVLTTPARAHTKPSVPEAPETTSTQSNTGITIDSAAPMDTARALEAMGGNKALLLRLCAAFLEEVPERCSQLETALQQRSWAEARRLAHAIKNSAAMLSATQLHEIAKKIELSCVDESPGADKELKAMLECMPALTAHINTLLKNGETPHV